MLACVCKYGILFIYSEICLVSGQRGGSRSDEFANALNRARDEAIEMVNQQTNEDTETDADSEQPTSMNTNMQMALFAEANQETRNLERVANIQLKTIKGLVDAHEVDPYNLQVGKRNLRLWKKAFGEYCPNLYEGDACNASAPYRTAEGYCNNVRHPTWGGVMTPQLREIPAMYDDGKGCTISLVIDSPRMTTRDGGALPSARIISNALFKCPGSSPRNRKLTVMVMQWGQFIDHEFVATPLMTMNGGRSCCDGANRIRPQCLPIDVPEDDPYFNGKTCMNFVRSAPAPSELCRLGFREQRNQVTSFIDGSVVYGSTLNDTLKLRRMSKGLLRCTKSDMLPRDSNRKCVLEGPDDYCQMAGDARVNVVPSLGWSHTTFMREHNRIASQLSALNPQWEDETIFQETRRIIAAIIQHINYNEYLPAILDQQTRDRYNLNVKELFNNCYRKTINPSISNVFAAAAFRMGHSQIPDYQATMTAGFQYDQKNPVEMTYHKPHFVLYQDGQSLAGLSRWLVSDACPKADGLFEAGTRDKLFLDDNGNSLDLPALNIQRGRDHGLPSYNHWRVHCGLPKAEMNEDGSFHLSDHCTQQTRKLQKIYSDIDDIDVYAGAMTEQLIANSSVGPTFACLLGKQFRRLKLGDRFWYESPDPVVKFTSKQLREIKKTSLARVLCNIYNMDSIQPDVFKMPCVDNERVPCSEIPEMDLSAWKSCDRTCSPNARPEYNLRKC